MNGLDKILLEGRVEDAKNLLNKTYDDMDYVEDIVSDFVDGDPSGNNKYLMWMVNRMIDGEEDTRDNTEGALIELVTDFHKPGVQARVPSKDINYYKTHFNYKRFTAPQFHYL